MSNHRKERSFRAFLSRNGFYIALVVCVIAAAVASYTAVNNILGNLQDQNNVVQQPPTPKPQTTPVEITPVEKPQDEVPITDEPESETDYNAEVEPEISTATDQLVPVYKLPLAGTVTNVWSGGELVRNVTLNDWRSHNGVDYAAAEGTPVTAVFSGEVIHTGYDPLMGYFVAQKLDSGYTIFYANLTSSVVVKPGERISQEAIVGYVGSSSILENGEQPHLHLEVKSGDNYIDPQSLFTS